MARPRVGTDGFVYFLLAETDLHARKYWRLPAEPAGVRVTIHELVSEPVEEASTNV